MRTTRRGFLELSAVAGGTILAGFETIFAFASRAHPFQDGFEGGKQIAVLEFTGESAMPVDTLLGSELDGRLFSDLSKLGPTNPFPSNETFYVRTRVSQLLDDNAWSISAGGLIEKPTTLAIETLKKIARGTGQHLMECSGNTRATRFGMLSVADWTGVPITTALEICKPAKKATHVVISGFDHYSASSRTSLPGADWIFELEQIKSSNAFLATDMNGEPLTRDHGAPIRLVVPGWYGCACIKWVNKIRFVEDQAEATTQMQEFAGRTHQPGVPKLARDYRPATIDQAAMPVRVEKWLVDGKIKYRVRGILWGGSQMIRVLEIRFNPEEDYVPVDRFSQTKNDPWSFWSHAWTPKATGTYMIRLRVTDPRVETKRLDSGHYVRSVEVNEI